MQIKWKWLRRKLMKINHYFFFCIHLLSMVALFSIVSIPAKADGLFYGESENMGDEASISSSKREEELFKAPLSISIVNAEQLSNAGVTTLAEAMKLVPGLVVRELTNGQYEVHIRGFDNIIDDSGLAGLTNTKTLIMIDNRLVFDYFNGGLFWETLPIGVEDIERIEVVRGAASALYGTNAMNGVIHFITKRPSAEQGAKVSIVAGNKDTRIAHVSLEKNISGHAVRLSGLSEKRERYESDYFSFASREYEDPDDIVFQSAQNEGIDSDNAKEIQSLMLTLNNEQTEYFTYDISYFHEDSEVQKVFINSRDIPFTTSLSSTDAINAKVNYGNLSTRLSHHWGQQDTNGVTGLKYDVAVSQATIEYQYRLPQWIIRPGINVNHITYDGDFIGGEHSLIEKNYLLRSEYFPSNQWRIIAALSYDDYNAPRDDHFSYQLMTTYQPRFDLLFRAGVQAANSSANMAAQYIDLEFTFPSVPNQPDQQVNVMGDKEGELSAVNSIELGTRYQFDSNQLFDVELFYSELKDIARQTNKGTVLVDNTYITTLELETLPSVAQQAGMTIDWRLELQAWNISAYLTWQKTNVIDQVETTALPFVTSNEPHKVTPEVYGGVTVDWRLASNINFNMQSYYLGAHEITIQQPRGHYQADGALNTNLTLNYRYNKNISGYAAIKNLSTSNESQSFYSDRLEPLYLLGIKLMFSKD